MAFSSFHLLLDAARMEESMQDAQDLNPDHASLFRHKKGDDEVLPAVAPFLFTFPHSKEFAEFVVDKGWGDSWGLWAESDASFEVLYKHFRQFLMIRKEDGEQLYFRFYDPRVLRNFLPTCNTWQLKDLFGPVSRYIMEDKDPTRCVIFSLQKEQLHVEYVAATEIQQALKKSALTSALAPSFWNHF